MDTSSETPKASIADVEEILTDYVGKPGESDDENTLYARAAAASYGYKVLYWGVNESLEEFRSEIQSYLEGFRDALNVLDAKRVVLDSWAFA